MSKKVFSPEELNFVGSNTVPCNSSAVEIFNLKKGQYNEFYDYCAKNAISILDSIRSQLKELYRISLTRNGCEETADFVQQILTQSDDTLSTYGQWIFYPWRSLAIHLLPQQQFHTVRTNRNREKISRDDQLKLWGKKVGVIGLSVGHSAAITLAQEAICGELRIADFDRIELSNLNRLRTSLANLGEQKAVVSCREILEIDPYLNVKSYIDGINDSNIEDFIFANGKLDLIVEECDSWAIKIKIRELAKKYQIPVIMDTNDRGMVDVERFDKEPDREILHGLLKGITAESLSSMSPVQNMEIIFRFLGGRDNISVPLWDTIKKIGSELISFPQLATEVHLGGALVAHTARNILLNKKMLSGRYYVDLYELLGQ